ncbi:hypothetical protein ACHAXA_006982 [Cyclostephanos tholiformis]|uniref:Peptidase S54 rhomboid domain-containing protein n=1 Tax=Cyclostephanos tholiformis TaxID=382380 RepID=A0ABD3RXL1_9STRA
MSRASETLASIPPATRLIVSVCSLTYAMQAFLDPPLADYALNPDAVLHDGQFHRLITGALLHSNLLHIVMNMTSTVAIGGMLEGRIGTLAMFLTISWGIFLVSSTYVLISWLAHVALGLRMRNCVGFSGVIFQLSVLESNYGPGERARSVFGIVDVPSTAYPWALLVALQFMMPRVSFLGHLSGILIGTMQVAVGVPHGTGGIRAGARIGLNRIVGGGGTTTTAAVERVARCASSLASRLRVISSIVREGAHIAIFGRGADANANVRMDELLGAAWGTDDVAAADSAGESGGWGGGDVEDDDEWVGLPAAIHRSIEER